MFLFEIERNLKAMFSFANTCFYSSMCYNSILNELQWKQIVIQERQVWHFQCKMYVYANENIVTLTYLQNDLAINTSTYNDTDCTNCLYSVM